MEDKTNFLRCLKQFDGLTWLTPTPLFYDRSPLVTEIPNSTWYHTWGGACILGSVTPPVARERSSRVPELPSFLGFPYLWLHALTQNDQIRYGNTYVEERVSTRSATSLHLQKCVARFVSDSWVYYTAARYSLGIPSVRPSVRMSAWNTGIVSKRL